MWPVWHGGGHRLWEVSGGPPLQIMLEWLLHRKPQGSLRRFQLPVSHVVPSRRSGWESHDYRKPLPRAKRHQSPPTCFNKSNATSQCSSDRVWMMENVILFIFFAPQSDILFDKLLDKLLLLNSAYAVSQQPLNGPWPVALSRMLTYDKYSTEIFS